MRSNLKQTISALLSVAALTGTSLAMAGSTEPGIDQQPITGSRLVNKDVTALPVMIYSRQDLLDSGFSNLANFIRNLPENTAGSFRPQSVNWWHRFDALGNLETTVTTQQQNLTLQLTGSWLGADWLFGGRHLDNRSSDVGRNYVIRSAAEALIESGDYNLANPYGANEAVLNAFRTTLYREARYDIDEYFAEARFYWLELPAGQVAAVIGAEYS